MLAAFERVIERNPVSVFRSTSIAFSFTHSTLKSYQWVFAPQCRLVALALSQDMHILEDNDMVATLQMPEKIWSTKDNSKIFQLKFTHFKERMHRLCSWFVLFSYMLRRKRDNFFNFLTSNITVIVEILLNKEIRIVPMVIFLSLQFGNHAVKFAS